MAKTKTKTKGKAGGMQIRQIRNKKERGGGGNFIRLKTDTAMKGFALFTPDPEVEGNPGWFEYLEHYDKPNNQYVPCTGDSCYMCDLGENPSPRALSLWYFPEAADEKDQFKSFKMNGFLIRDFDEIHTEEGGVLGRKFRVKRMTDDGKYRVSPTAETKPLPKKEIARLLKLAEENGQDFAADILRQAKRAAEKISAVDALTDDDDDDDDDEDEEETTSRKGKASTKNSSKSKKDEDEDDDDDEDDEDEDEDEDEDDEDENDDDDEDDDEDDESDDDEDEDEDDDEEDDDEDEDDEDEDEEEAEGLKSQKAVVTTPDEANEVISAKLDGAGRAVKLYVGDGLDPDWDKIKKGVEITVDALKDDEDDWVLTSLKVAKAKADSKAKPKGRAKK